MLDNGEFRSLSSRRLRAALSQTRLLRSDHLNTDDLQALSGLDWKELSANKNEDVIQDGNLSRSFYMLLDGWGYRYKLDWNGNRQIVGLLQAGDAVNLDACLFDAAQYGVATLMASKLAVVPGGRLLAAARRHPGAMEAVATLTMVERSILMQWSFCLGRKSAIQRVSHLLCEIAARVGMSDNWFWHPLTQLQLADILGLTPIHINRTLKQLEHEGLIATSRGKVTIFDHDALAEIAEFDPAYLHLPSQSSNEDRTVAVQARQLQTAESSAI